MPIRLIASDLDGTLLSDKKTVSEGNCRAIRDAIQAGIPFVVATGRPVYNIDAELFRRLGVEYVISANGTCIHRLSDGARIYEEPLPEEDALELTAFLRQYSVYLRAFGPDVILMERRHADLLGQLGLDAPVQAALANACRVVEDLPEYIRAGGGPISKLAIYFIPREDGSYLHYDEIRAKIEADPRFDQVCGGCHNMEITRAGASKGKALLWLADYLGIGHEETMACGDTENDVAMLRAAGVGVAMANAEESAKAAADFISTSNEEDGVAFAIRKFTEAGKPSADA